jgi:hypothetical protein
VCVFRNVAVPKPASYLLISNLPFIDNHIIIFILHKLHYKIKIIVIISNYLCSLLYYCKSWFKNKNNETTISSFCFSLTSI